MRLTKNQRRNLIREARRYQREQGWRGADVADVADHVAGILFSDEDEYGIAGAEAIEVSDYCYGIAQWVCPAERW